MGHLESRPQVPWGPGNAKLRGAGEQLLLSSKDVGNCGAEEAPVGPG